MHRIDHPLLTQSLGSQHSLASFHFGTPGHGQKIYIQASLHADELPGMLVAWHLKQKLLTLEDAGQIKGEIILVPSANPLGLDQTLLGVQLGRFERSSGENFNRHYAAFAHQIYAELKEHLGTDSAANTRLIRQAMRAHIARLQPHSELTSLRKTLLGLAADADVVLDLHCDTNAALHLYTGTPLWTQCEPLARYLGAHATLLATESGDNPFDEACSQLWWQIAELVETDQLEATIDMACLSVTVELRGQTDVNHAQAEQDAEAILAFLAYRGVIAAEAPPLPPLLHPATPLAGSESLDAPHPGVVAYHVAAGTVVQPGDAIADVIDPINDRVTTLHAKRAGVVYALELRHYATTGMWLAKIATKEAFKTGKLLTA